MTYVKIDVIGSDTPATICLEDVSAVGALIQVVSPGGDVKHEKGAIHYFSGQYVPARVVVMRPGGHTFAVTPEVAEKLEKRLVVRDDGYEPLMVKKEVIKDPCQCTCERCALFPAPHSIYHLDCCGGTAKRRTEPTPALTVERDDGWTVQVSPGMRTPQSGIVNVPPGYAVLVNGVKLNTVVVRVAPGDVLLLEKNESSAVKRLDESCAACGAVVFTSPSGLVCVNGHGGPGIVP